MRLHIITFLLLFAFTASLHAQNSLTISGRIIDKEKKAIEFASISLQQCNKEDCRYYGFSRRHFSA